MQYFIVSLLLFTSLFADIRRSFQFFAFLESFTQLTCFCAVVICPSSIKINYAKFLSGPEKFQQRILESRNFNNLYGAEVLQCGTGNILSHLGPSTISMHITRDGVHSSNILQIF